MFIKYSINIISRGEVNSSLSIERTYTGSPFLRYPEITNQQERMDDLNQSNMNHSLDSNPRRKRNCTNCSPSALLDDSQASTSSMDIEVENYNTSKETTNKRIETGNETITQSVEEIRRMLRSLTAHSSTVSDHKKQVEIQLKKIASQLTEIMTSHRDEQVETKKIYAEHMKAKRELEKLQRRKDRQQEYWEHKTKQLSEELNKAKTQQIINIEDSDKQSELNDCIQSAISPIFQAIQNLNKDLQDLRVQVSQPTTATGTNRDTGTIQSRPINNKKTPISNLTQIMSEQELQVNKTPVAVRNRTYSHILKSNRANATATRKDYLGIQTRIAQQEKKIKNDTSYGSKLTYDCPTIDEAKKKLGEMASQRDIQIKYQGKLHAYTQATKIIILTPNAEATKDITNILVNRKIIDPEKASENRNGLRPTAHLKEVYLSNEEIAGIRATEKHSISDNIYNCNEWIKEAYPNHTSYLESNAIEPVSYNRLTSTLTVRIEPNLLSEALKLGTINYGWARVKIVESVDPLQCYHCQNYNHTAKKCTTTAEAPICFKCAGNHRGNGCTVTKENYKCINCIRAKRPNINHKCNANSCPEKIKQQLKYTKKIDYAAAITTSHDK